MIEYVKVRGCPRCSWKRLPELYTLEELQNHFYSLEGELAAIEAQLNEFERFTSWPKTGDWSAADEWLEATLDAKKFKLWEQIVVRATLNKLEKQESTDRRIRDLEEEVSLLGKSIEIEKDKRKKLMESLNQQMDRINRKRVISTDNSNQEIKSIYRVLYENGLLSDRLKSISKAIECNPEWGLKKDIKEEDHE